MPYIAEKDRPAFDKHIDDLSIAINDLAAAYAYPGAFAGLLNYCMTRLALQVSPARRYWVLAIIVGVFVTAMLEYYRKWAAPYEDEQIAKNGDVYPDPHA